MQALAVGTPKLVNQTANAAWWQSIELLLQHGIKLANISISLDSIDINDLIRLNR